MRTQMCIFKLGQHGDDDETFLNTTTKMMMRTLPDDERHHMCVCEKTIIYVSMSLRFLDASSFKPTFRFFQKN